MTSSSLGWGLMAVSLVVMSLVGSVAVDIPDEFLEFQHETRGKCLIDTSACPLHPEYEGLGDDMEIAYVQLGVGGSEEYCLRRAQTYHEWCGSSPEQQVIAWFVSTMRSRTYPPSQDEESRGQGTAVHAAEAPAPTRVEGGVDMPQYASEKRGGSEGGGGKDNDGGDGDIGQRMNWWRKLSHEGLSAAWSAWLRLADTCWWAAGALGQGLEAAWRLARSEDAGARKLVSGMVGVCAGGAVCLASGGSSVPQRVRAAVGRAWWGAWKRIFMSLRWTRRIDWSAIERSGLALDPVAASRDFRKRNRAGLAFFGVIATRRASAVAASGEGGKWASPVKRNVEGTRALVKHYGPRNVFIVADVMDDAGKQEVEAYLAESNFYKKTGLLKECVIFVDAVHRTRHAALVVQRLGLTLCVGAREEMVLGMTSSVAAEGEVYWFRVGGGPTAKVKPRASLISRVFGGARGEQGGVATCVEGWEGLVRGIRLPELLQTEWDADIGGAQGVRGGAAALYAAPPAYAAGKFDPGEGDMFTALKPRLDEGLGGPKGGSAR